MILFLFIIPSLFATSTIKMLTQSTRAFPEHWWEQLRKQWHRNTARVKYETVTWSNAFSKNSTCMLLGRMKKYPYKKKIFECIIHYGDHLLITENPEEPVRVMEVSETGSPWSCWALYVCGHTGVSGACKGAIQMCVSVLDNGWSCCICIDKFFPLKLYVICTNSGWSQYLTTFVGLCSFCSPTFLWRENIFQEFDGFSVRGKMPHNTKIQGFPCQ